MGKGSKRAEVRTVLPDQGAGIKPVGVVKGKLVCWLVRVWPMKEAAWC